VHSDFPSALYKQEYWCPFHTDLRAGLDLAGEGEVSSSNGIEH
jgi:hypothetical protein